MEAATPLRQPNVRTVGDRLAIDGLVVDDECAVRLVRERERSGGDTVKTVREAIEIGARVLDREQAAANAEFVKTEFERASREVQTEFADKARDIAQFFEHQFEQVFGADNGQLARKLERRFGDGSAASVQNRVREAVAETLARSREDLVRQFSAADDRNPLADFKIAAVRSIKEATGKTGDIVVSIDAAAGPARGRIVIEVKDRRLSSPRSLGELDEAMAQRSADFAVLVVPTADEVPARLEPLRG